MCLCILKAPATNTLYITFSNLNVKSRHKAGFHFKYFSELMPALSQITFTTVFPDRLFWKLSELNFVGLLQIDWLTLLPLPFSTLPDWYERAGSIPARSVSSAEALLWSFDWSVGFAVVLKSCVPFEVATQQMKCFPPLHRLVVAIGGLSETWHVLLQTLLDFFLFQSSTWLPMPRSSWGLHYLCVSCVICESNL